MLVIAASCWRCREDSVRIAFSIRSSRPSASSMRAPSLHVPRRPPDPDRPFQVVEVGEEDPLALLNLRQPLQQQSRAVPTNDDGLVTEEPPPPGLLVLMRSR